MVFHLKHPTAYCLYEPYRPVDASYDVRWPDLPLSTRQHFHIRFSCPAPSALPVGPPAITGPLNLDANPPRGTYTRSSESTFTCFTQCELRYATGSRRLSSHTFTAHGRLERGTPRRETVPLAERIATARRGTAASISLSVGRA
jgi:hypothetical protein